MEFIISVLLYSPYRIRFYDTKVHLQKTSEFWGLCDELAKAGTITRAENKLIQKNRISLNHYLLPEKDFYRLMHRYFTDVPVKQVIPVWPTYVGRRKQ